MCEKEKDYWTDKRLTNRKFHILKLIQIVYSPTQYADGESNKIVLDKKKTVTA